MAAPCVLRRTLAEVTAWRVTIPVAEWNAAYGRDLQLFVDGVEVGQIGCAEAVRMGAVEGSTVVLPLTAFQPTSGVPSLLPHLPPPVPGATIELEQKRLEFLRKTGDLCACCGQRVQVYRRSITGAMAAWLISLVRGTTVTAQGASWTDVKTLPARGGDYAKLLYWNLIERIPPEDGRNSGQFRPTPEGFSFVAQHTTVSQYIYVYDEKLIGRGGRQLNVIEALGARFDYAALMSGNG